MASAAGGRTLDKHALVENLRQPSGRYEAVSEMTMKTYLGRLSRLEQISKRDLDDALLHPKETYDTISKKYSGSATTRKGMLTAVMALYAHSPAYAKRHEKEHREWSLLHRMQAGIEAKERNNNTITVKQREEMTSISDLQKAASKIEKAGLENETQSMAHLLLLFMTEVPPKRLDLGELAVYKTKPASYDGNYVIVPTKGQCKLVLQQYKTFKRYGVITDVLPAKLASALRASLKAFPREHVFGRMNPDQYGYFIRKVTKAYAGKESGINDIRHAYISERCVASKVTITELQAIARSMGHNTDMQSKYQLVVRGGGTSS